MLCPVLLFRGQGVEISWMKTSFHHELHHLLDLKRCADDYRHWFQFSTCPAQCFRFAFAGFCFARPPCLDHPLRWEHQVVIFIAVVWTYALAVESPICIGHHHFKVETSGVFYAMPPVEFVVLEDVDHDRAEWSKIPVHFSSASAFVSPRSGSLLVPTWSLRAHLGKTSVSFRCSSCLFSSDSRILISSSSSWAGGEFYAASTSMSWA